jgi:hypothetical protein
MVSIFAEQIYQETVTGVNFNDGQRVSNITIDNFPLTDVSALVGGFKYVERVVVGFTIIGTFGVFNPKDGFNRRWEIDVVGTEFIFDDTIELLPSIGNKEAFQDFIEGPNTETYTDLSAEVAFTADGYIDTPVKCSTGLQFFEGKDPMEFDGNSTVDVETTITIVGRQP